MENGKTSTFTIHHDRCNPASWTADDVLAFDRFVRYGGLQHAARLSKLGVQLVLSEHHAPKGGELELVGHATPCDLGTATDNLADIDDGEDIQEIVPVYRGQTVYAARYTIGDGQGNVEGTEYEIKPTEADARAFLDGFKEAAE